MRLSHFRIFGVLSAILALNACSSDSMNGMSGSASPSDPDTAEKAAVDRFSDAAGHLQKRSDSPALPGPNEAVDFDQGPFITEGLGPNAEVIQYYNFDVQPTTPAPIYALMKAGKPVEGQLNIVDVLPGAPGYNDFWQVIEVTVPDSYVANTLTSAAAVKSSGYPMNTTTTLVNCPIVPEGSTAKLRFTGDTSGKDLIRGWYQGKVVFYFTFGEKALTAKNGLVPTSPIYVTFNDDAKGPASGFMTETDGMQTHNVVATLPADTGYSPLWAVTPFPDAKFDDVMNLATAATAAGSGAVAADVNCPVVSLTAQ